MTFQTKSQKCCRAEREGVLSRRVMLSLAGAASGMAVLNAVDPLASQVWAQATVREEIKIKVGNITLSGFYRAAENPKALIFCIHGGTCTARYFDLSSQRGETIFDLAPQFGYSVVSIDRPGYGAAESAVLNFYTQAAVLKSATRIAFDTYAPKSAGIFLVGHSIGAMLCMIMGSQEDGSDYLGMDLNGAGLVFRPAAKQALGRRVDQPNPNRVTSKEARLRQGFGPVGTYRPEVAEEDFRVTPLSQPAEIKEAIGWEQRMLDVAPTIKTPVNFSLSEFDALWEASPEIIARCRGLFSASPMVDVRAQLFAGHRVHLHAIARGYHLRTIAFADDSVALKSRKGRI